VVVTGASAGVGRATAIAFARKGARVALIARGLEGLEATAKDVEAEGGEALVLPVDVAQADRLSDAAREVEETLGPIDVWVNNAMATVFGPVSEVSPAEFRRVTEVTYLGTVNGTMAAISRMMPRDNGIIVQVGSALAYRGIPLQAAYCGAKHGIVGFTESLRAELLHERSGVRVTMVQLPALNTPQFDWSRSKMPRKAQPVPPIYQPEVAARAIVWAAEHDRREVKVGGPTVATILADKVAPGILDHYLARTGIRAQQTDEREDPQRLDNLFQPVSEDVGAHGRFDERAHHRSIQFWVTRHRGSLAAAIAAAGSIARLASANAARKKASR
jgi:short-subunit dehydrogenase